MKEGLDAMLIADTEKGTAHRSLTEAQVNSLFSSVLSQQQGTKGKESRPRKWVIPFPLFVVWCEARSKFIVHNS